MEKTIKKTDTYEDAIEVIQEFIKLAKKQKGNTEATILIAETFIKFLKDVKKNGGQVD